MRHEANTGNRRRARDEYPVIVKNTSSEAAPPWACLQVVDASGVSPNLKRTVTVTKPTGSDGVYLVCGPLGIPAGGRGRARDVGVTAVQYTGDIPVPGDTVGPANDSWFVSTGATNWPVVGGGTDEANEESVVAILLGVTTSDDTEVTLRMFVLTATKTLADDEATVRWLDHDGLVASDEDLIIYDPDFRFAGQIESYAGFENGFHGYALQRYDMASEEPGPPRYEIIAMERYAEWAVVEFDQTPTNGWVLMDGGDGPNFGGDDWNWRRPVEDGDEITLVDPAGVLPDDPENGDRIVVRLQDPDTDPPTYMPMASAPAASAGTFICQPLLEIDPGTFTAMEEGAATVKSVGEGGALTTVGERTVFNPFACAIPAEGSYPCNKTYDDPDDEADDEYTIIGLDILYVLKALTGFAQNKSLAVEDEGDDIEHIKWLGVTCASE